MPESLRACRTGHAVPPRWYRLASANRTEHTRAEDRPLPFALSGITNFWVATCSTLLMTGAARCLRSPGTRQPPGAERETRGWHCRGWQRGKSWCSSTVPSQSTQRDMFSPATLEKLNIKKKILKSHYSFLYDHLRDTLRCCSHSSQLCHQTSDCSARLGLNFPSFSLK